MTNKLIIIFSCTSLFTRSFTFLIRLSKSSKPLIRNFVSVFELIFLCFIYLFNFSIYGLKLYGLPSLLTNGSLSLKEEYNVSARVSMNLRQDNATWAISEGV